MPGSSPKPGHLTRPAWPFWAGLGMVGLLSSLWFSYDLPAEPHFADESAYVSQAYFADLWLRGDRDNPEWLEYPAFDLPPLPKYLTGGALLAIGQHLPDRPRPGRGTRTRRAASCRPRR